jgi:dihydroorotase
MADDRLFLAALTEARRLGLPVSCHCDLGGEAQAIDRAIKLGKQAGARIHIAHVSTAQGIELIRRVKSELNSNAADSSSFALTCEVTPHHLALTGEEAKALGAESFGKVNPPLGNTSDRQALIGAVLDGTIDIIATDHAPHTAADKKAGAPGFIGLETAFSVCLPELVREGGLSLSRLSALMSAAPAGIIGFRDRGRIAPGFRADFFVADTGAFWRVDSAALKSRGKNSPFAGKELRGRVLMTIHGGRVVYEALEG